MNAKTITLLTGVLTITTVPLQAGSRISANYTVSADTADTGGKRTNSANYTNDGSLGGVTGRSTAAIPAETLKGGYTAQLYEVTGLTLTATTLILNEGGTDQLAVWQLLGDATFLTVPATGVTWSVASGPLTSINASGLVTAGIVFQNTAATAQSIYAGHTGTLNVIVFDSIQDNFGTYAGDGVGDDWQVQYFGLPPNPNAGPNADVSGTGQANLFKYIAGLNPLDPNSRFTLTIRSVPGEPARKNLTFAPRLTDRIYTVTAKPSLLTGSYMPLTNPSAPSDNGQERTITDLNANDAVKLYRVEITKP